MSALETSLRPAPPAGPAAELRKLAAFARRDLLTAWSYRVAFAADLLGLAGMTVLFYFVGLMADPAKMPTYSGTRVTYLEFAVVGLSLGLFMQLALDRVGQALRNEQLMGTLESILLTPTATATIQAGSVAYDLVYVPLRTAAFVTAIGLAFGLRLDLGGLLPAIAILVAFMPFVWGIGVMSAAAVLTFRRGSGVVGLAVAGLAIVSGVYFPLELLPGWLEAASAVNPVALATEGMREALLGGSGWGEAGTAILALAAAGAASLIAGFAAFRAAMRRERRLGTLGLY